MQLVQLLGMHSLHEQLASNCQLGSRQEAVKRTTAVQQRFKLSLSQLREACRVLAGGARDAATGILPGTEKQPVQLANVRAALVAEQLIDA